MDNIPTECLVEILRYVDIAEFDDGTSKLGNLNKCGWCVYQNINECKHLRESEVVGIKMLKLVCTGWRDCIRKYFVFRSGPKFILPDDFLTF